MTVKEIVELYLKSNGYDGLFNPGECGCLINDLVPCGQISEDCEAGYKGPCRCGEHDWEIYRSKQDSQEKACLD